MSNKEAVRSGFSAALDRVIMDLAIDEMDVIFNKLDEGFPPSCIAGLEGHDMEEIVQFLCKYHHAKMKQAGHK